MDPCIQSPLLSLCTTTGDLINRKGISLWLSISSFVSGSLFCNVEWLFSSLSHPVGGLLNLSSMPLGGLLTCNMPSFGNLGHIGVDPTCNEAISIFIYLSIYLCGAYTHTYICIYMCVENFSFHGSLYKFYACFCLPIALIAVWWWHCMTCAKSPAEAFKFPSNKVVPMSKLIYWAGHILKI